jgi:hypothetical protein
VDALSPNGNYVATAYERNCGATADFSTIVNFHSSRDKFNGDDNIVFVVKGRQAVACSWEGSTSLRITCVNCEAGKIYKREKAWKNVVIVY